MDAAGLTDTKVDVFLLCNAAYLSRNLLAAGDPVYHLDFLLSLQDYVGAGLTADDCRKYLTERKAYCALLAQARNFVARQLPLGGQTTGCGLIIDPREVFMARGFQFKDIVTLAKVTKVLLEVNGGILKIPLTREDFQIPKVKVISCYFKFVSLKRKITEISSKLTKSAMEHLSIHSVKVKMAESDIGERQQECEIAEAHLRADQRSDLIHKSAISDRLPNLGSSIQLELMATRFKDLLADHVRFTWTAQAGLFIGKLEQFILSKVKCRSRSQSKPNKRGKSSDR